MQSSNTNITTAPAANRPKGGILRRYWLEIVGGIGTIAAGIGASCWSIRKSFFANAEEDDLFKNDADLKRNGKINPDLNYEQLKGVVAKRDKAREDLADLVKGNPGEYGGKHYRQKTRLIESEYDAAMRTEMRKFGINNIMDEFGLLRNHQRWEAGMAFLAGWAVALGVVTSSISLVQSLKNKNDIEAGQNSRTL